MDAPPLTEYELLSAAKGTMIEEPILPEMETLTGKISAKINEQLGTNLEQIGSLHENPYLLPSPFVEETVLHTVVVLIAISIFHIFVHNIIKIIRWARSIGKKGSPEQEATKVQASYKIVSLVMNGLLAYLGAYHFFFTLPETTEATERIVGFEHLLIFPCLIIAYQLWALPVGLMVDEPTEMLVHHCAVLMIACLSAFFTNGFRYHNPFFFGLIEISSVPLVLMNVFKDDKELARRLPKTSLLTSIAFCLSFLITRVAMWIPQAIDFIWLCSLLCYTSEAWLTKVGLSAAILVCLFLTGLQLFWANKIINGIFSALTGSNTKPPMKVEK